MPTETRPAPGSAADRLLHELLHRFVLAAGRIAERQFDGDIRPRDGNFLHRLACDEIAAGVGIDDGGETRLHVGFGKGHR